MLYNPEVFPREQNSSAIREWWHSIMREQGVYPSYAFFLVLSSNKNAVEYLSKYGSELDHISGKDCLILVLNKKKFQRFGFDREMRTIGTLRSDGNKLNLQYWKALISDLLSAGYSVHIANYFGIPYSEFPCLIVFQDIRSSGHVLISLHGMGIDEIADRMRTIFSVIHAAATEKKPVIQQLESLTTKEAFQKGSQKLIRSISSMGEKTFAAAMETWVKSLIP